MNTFWFLAHYKSLTYRLYSTAAVTAFLVYELLSDHTAKSDHRRHGREQRQLINSSEMITTDVKKSLKT